MSKDYRVNTFGLTDEENTLVEESLPTRAYELYIADTPTDVIAIGCDAMIVNAAALDQDSADMIFDLYSQVDGCTNETVIWLDEPMPPKAAAASGWSRCAPCVCQGANRRRQDLYCRQLSADDF